MRFLFMALAVFITLLCLTVYYQIIKPLYKGTILFPIFRSTERKESELTKTEEDIDSLELDKKIIKNRKKEKTLKQEVKKGLKEC